MREKGEGEHHALVFYTRYHLSRGPHSPYHTSEERMGKHCNTFICVVVAKRVGGRRRSWRRNVFLEHLQIDTFFK